MTTSEPTSQEQAALTLDGEASEVTKTYAGAAFSLPVGGGSGTGAISATKTGGTGTGTVGVDGDNVTLSVTACGTFVIEVTKAASGYYLAKTQTFTVTVNKGTQTITGLSNVNKTYGDANFNLSATSSSGLTVSYNISPSSVATVSGSEVTIAGAGTATITASQTGDANLWNAAADVTATLTVAKATPTVTASVSPTSIRVGGTATLTGTTTSGGSMTFGTSASGVASLSGSAAGSRTVTGAGYGTATLTVTSDETANYNEVSATCTITVLLVKPTASDTITGVQNRGTSTVRVNISQPASGGGNGSLVLMRQGASITATATDGSGIAGVAAEKAAGDSALDWTHTTFNSTAPITYAIVNSKAASRAYQNLKGLTPAAQYFVRAYSYNIDGNVGAGNHSYAYGPAGAEFSFWMLSTEPGTQASISSAQESSWTAGSRKGNVTWTAGAVATASGESSTLKTLLVAVEDGDSVTPPTDGTTYSAGAMLGDGMVVFAGTGTSAEITGLEPTTTYTIYAYAYAEGGDSTTANYNTTSPATGTLTTTQSQGPTVWATGVTTTNYLLNWTPVAGETTGYDVALDENSAFSSPWRTTPFTNNFTAGEGWERSETSTGSGAWLTVPSGSASGNEEKWYLKGVQRRTGSSDTATVGGVSDTGYLYLTTTGDYVDTPVLYGDLSEIVVGWRRGGGDRSLRIDILKPDRSDFKTGVASWSIAGTATAGVISTNIFTNSIHMSGGAGYRIRFYNSSSTEGTIYLHHIHLKVAGSAAGYPGYGMEAGGLTSGSTYYAKVRKNPDGDWSDDLGVKAGVLPTGLGATAARNSVTFTWSGANSPAAYAIQVSKTGAPSSWADKGAGTAALALDSFGSKDWKYIGATATTSSGTLGTAPGYASGHIPGVAGNGLESKSFPIAGMTGVRVSFTVEPFNLNQTGGQLSDGRVVVYYQIDDGNWNFLGTAAPVSTSTGANAAFDVPAGALAEGNRVAFRLVAPNAHKYGTSYFISPRLTNVKVSRVSKGSGDFSESSAGVDYKTVDTTQAGTSYTVTGLTAGETVYFRVQALQGSMANPTAKSVWVEGTGTASTYTPPSAITFSSVTRNSMTVSWTAGDTTDFSKYVLQRSTASDFSAGLTSYDVTGGATTKDISGLAGNTTYYFRVKAVGTDSQESAWSASANQTTAVYTAPGTPTASAITRNSMRLTWTAGNTKDLDHYELVVEQGGVAISGSPFTVAAGTLYKDLTGLTANKPYTFKVRAVGTDTPQASAYSGTGTATTLGFSGPVLTGVTSAGRNKFTVNWTAVGSANANGYVIQWTKCAKAGGAETLVSTCLDGGTTESNRTLLATSPQTSAWSWQRQSSSYWPEWDNGYGTFSQSGHNLMSSGGIGVTPNPKPALVSPVLNLSAYTGGYVSFSHGSRHNGYKDPYSKVTLYYSTDGGTTWNTTDTRTSGAASGATWTANQRLEIPTGATGPGKTNVRLKLQADSAITKDDGGKVFTGPMLKLVKVYGTGSRGEYNDEGSSCDSVHAEVPVSGGNTSSYEITGLDPSATYYFRVLTVGTDSVRSDWSEGSGETTAFEGPTGVAVTSATRYTLTATWDKYTETGYTTTYNVRLSECGGAESGTVEDGTCPDNARGTSASESAWWYRMSKSTGGTTGEYPQYLGGGHACRAAQSSIADAPGVASPMLDMSGYTGGKISFNVWSYVNSSTYYSHTKVYLHYRVKSGGTWGAWSAKDNAYSAAAATTAASPGNAREITLPPASLVADVQYMLSADDASVVDLGEEYSPRYVNPGPVLKGITITGESSGSGVFGEGCTVEEHLGVNSHNASATGTTSYEFGLAANSANALVPGKTYYVQVETVLTKTGDTATSAGSEATGATLAMMAPPAEVWGEDIKQKHMTVAWLAAEGADADTRYKLEVTACSAGDTTEIPVHEASTAGRLTTEDDWVYTGGGTPTGAEPVTLENGTEVTKATEVGDNGIAATGGETYPAYAGNASDQSHVLAGYGDPGIETLEFSTVGATAGTVTFKHGRWYNETAALSATATLELSYSLDGGTSWTAFDTKSIDTTVATTANASTGVSQSSDLPAGALGKPHVKVRITARNATVVDKGSSTYHAIGAQVRQAKVELTKTKGNYDTCAAYLQTFEGLTAEQLEQALGDSPALAANTPYYFRVAASDGKRTLADGKYAYGAWTDGTAKTLDRPAQPAAPTLSNVGRTTMTVTWTEAARAETYKVYVYNSSGTQLASYDAGSALTFQLTGLTKSTTYQIAVSGCADGTEGPVSAKTTQATSAAFKVGALVATNVLDTSMTLTWSAGGKDHNYLTFFQEDGTGDAVTQEIACPAKTLARTDSGNGWFYVGGSASYPAYWSGSTAGDEGHALIYPSSTKAVPGIRSRWFSTFGATSAVVDFMHGRFNSGADSTVSVEYSIDGGATWVYAGQAPSTSASTPTEHRQISLPAAALGRRSVMVQLTAPGASGNKGAHVKDLKVVLTGPKGAQLGARVDAGANATSYTKTGLTAGKRYWVLLESEDTDGTTSTDSATLWVATRTKTTGVLASQGFEGSSERSGLDPAPGWTCSIQYITVDGSTTRTPAQRLGTDPEVKVVYGENPLYGDRALRMSGSKAGNVFGVADFTYALDSRGGTVTIPFSAKDLKKNDFLYVAYKRGSGAWTIPSGLTAGTSGISATMGRIGVGGDDVLNQNWPYNREKNSTTRPAGDAFTFEATGTGDLTVRVAYCGQGGTGADARYYYIDELLLEEAAGTPSPASATANDDGTVTVTWTPPSGQSVIVVRGRDQRTPPWASGVDLSAVPEGYEVLYRGEGNVASLTGNADTLKWPDSVSSLTDKTADSGWKYFYYIYAVTSSGAYGKTPALTTAGAYPFAVVRGTVHAIASMGWDGWDAHPWKYIQGRVSNPGRSSDAGWWKANGMNGSNVRFYHEYAGDIGETDSDTITRPGSGYTAAKTYASIYGQKSGSNGKYGTTGYADDDATKQQGLSSYTNYFGKYSYRFSGGGGYVWSGEHTYVNWSNETVVATNPIINTNNPAIQFANVDLSGYKNVEFQMHYAGPLQGGGNYLHLAISTNGGAEGTWKAIDNLDSSGWRVKTQAQDYGLQVQEMLRGLTAEKVDFYDQSLAQYGNPFILKVPDSVTQFMARVMFYDSNGRSGGAWREAAIFLDEVRLLGEVALETPHPVITDNGKNQLTVCWSNVTDATGYNVRITAVASNGVVKLAEPFGLPATPDDWTSGTTGSGVGPEFTTTGSHSGLAKDYGMHMRADGEWLASPAVGAATSVVFHAKATATTAGNNLIIETSTDDGATWAAVKTIAASDITTGWKKQDVALPYRQWQKVRFRFERSGADLYIDDIEIYGAGDYRAVTTTVGENGALLVNGLTVTNRTFTGLTAGTRYFAQVQAYGNPNGVEVTSPWGETADYTSGDFNVAPDGFEMTRSTWTAPGSGSAILVMAVNDGKEFSEVPAPTGDPSVGAAFGEGVVIAKETGAKSGAGFEHLVPYGTRTDTRTQRYVVYWKHGGYWEGRLETNAVLGTYVCQSADAMAITNSTAVPAGTQGKGWSGGWKPWDDDDAKASPEYISSVGSATTESGYTYYGLVGSNKLAGAGGNMIRFTMTDNNRKLRLARALASPVEDGVVWIMFTVRSQFGGDNNAKMFGMQLSTGTDATTAGSGIFASIGNLDDRYSGHPALQIDTGLTDSWPNGSGRQWDSSQSGGTPYYLDDTDNSDPKVDRRHTIVIKYDVSEKKIQAAAIYTPSAGAAELGPNSSAPEFHCEKTLTETKKLGTIILMGRGYNGNLDFDEVRVGKTWGELVGKPPVPPFPLTTASATIDGKEMIRLAWAKRAGGSDTIGGVAVTRPATDRVIILDKDQNSPFTAAELAAKTGAVGSSRTIDGVTVRVVYNGTGTEVEHVVLPGTTHRYAFYSFAEGVYADSALEVSTDATGNELTMETYGGAEWVNPFSYTNATAAGSTWQGGHGFENSSASGYFFWVKTEPEEQESRTWEAVKPGDVVVATSINAAADNYRTSAGNVLHADLASDGTEGYVERQLTGSPWYSGSGDTMYVAFRMAYAYGDNANRWAGLKLKSSDGETVFIGKAGGDHWFTLGVSAKDSKSASETTAWSASADIKGFHENNTDYSDRSYLIVAKIRKTSGSYAEVWANAYKPVGGTGGAARPMPADEPPSWDVWDSQVYLPNVQWVQFCAGASSGYGQIGDVYFDELRWGNSWKDILGPKVPTDAWMDGETLDKRLGDYVDLYVYDTPHGDGQSAAVMLSYGPSGGEPEYGQRADATYQDKIYVPDGATAATATQTNSQWKGTLQFTNYWVGASGGHVRAVDEGAMVYGYGLAEADNQTVYTKDHSVAATRANTYTVKGLGTPGIVRDEDDAIPQNGSYGGTNRNILVWTPWSGTYDEVMVVRYLGDTEAKRRYAWNLSEDHFRPEQGRSYMVGDTVEYDTGATVYHAKVIYRGRGTAVTDTGLSKGEWYYYGLYTVNNGYYSRREVVALQVGDYDAAEPEIDGNPVDWAGTPAVPWNSSTTSEKELIWTDKAGEERVDHAGCASADILEFRVKANTTNVYFLLKLAGGVSRQATNTYAVVGVDTRMDPASEKMNFLGDETFTEIGGRYYTNSAAAHYPRRQMAVHWVNNAEPNWQVEMHADDGQIWYAPAWWQAAGSANGASESCIEWVVPRSELGLDWASRATGATSLTGRFTVATFVNTGAWNNQGTGVVRIEANSSAAADMMAIAPYGENDKDCALSAWDEGLETGKVDFWMDGTFNAAGVVANAAPETPAVTGFEGATRDSGSGSPFLVWKAPAGYTATTPVANPKGLGLYEFIPNDPDNPTGEGVYEKTSDTAPVTGKTYYTRSGEEDAYVYTATTPLANPKAAGLYELADGAYVATADTETQSGKTYYTRDTGDADGFVTGWLVELSETENFGGTDGNSENGPVAFRVNVELTPEIAAEIAAGTRTTISWKSKTSDLTSKTFWWRVRARDDNGELSAGTIRRYDVTGKADNDGPVAKLLYVGLNVDRFLTNVDYRSMEERNGEAYSVLDSEFGSTSHSFGFAIQWDDVNGVYATNHARAAHDGVPLGGYAWNILENHDNGVPFGRVSPNWDLMMVNTNLGEARFDTAEWTAPTAGTPSTYRYRRVSTNEVYTLSEDADRVSGKTYWESTGNGKYAALGAEDSKTMHPAEQGLYERALYYAFKRATSSSAGETYYAVTTPEGKKAPDSITVGSGGTAVTLYWGWYDRMTLPQTTGDLVTHGWVLEWGKDEAFNNSQTWGTGVLNEISSLTNYVSSVFDLPTYDPEVALYLTVSAEDGCKEGANGPESNVPWPTSPTKSEQGSYQDSAVAGLTSGWCADAPNPARNVTVNQLLYIPVKDDDMIGPVASTAKWGGDGAGMAEFKPSMLVATNTVSGTALDWTTLQNKVLPALDGEQRDVTYQMTDEALGQDLTFLFNVYDTQVTSGLKRGTDENDEVDVDGTTPLGRPLTNTAFRAMTWDATGTSYVATEPETENPKTEGLYERNASTGRYVATSDETVTTGKQYYAKVEGAGGWKAGPENTAKFSASKSDIRTLEESGGSWSEGDRGDDKLGTGPSTVLAWDFGTITAPLLEGMFGQDNILDFVSTNSAGVTNLIQLHAWDRDNDRDNDQSDSEITFGKVLFSDDDATEPKVADFRVTGTGTNMVKFGEVAKSTWWTRTVEGTTESGRKYDGMAMGTAQVLEHALSGGGRDASGDASAKDIGTTGSGDNYYANFAGSGVMQGTSYNAKSRYFEWTLKGTATTWWLVDALTFKNRVTAAGPTEYALTVCEQEVPANYSPADEDGKRWRLWNSTDAYKDGGNWIGTGGPVADPTRCDVYGSVNVHTAALQTVAIPMTGVSSGQVKFKLGVKHDQDAEWGTVKLQVSLNGGAWTDTGYEKSNHDALFSNGSGGYNTGVINTWQTIDFSGITVDTGNDGVADKHLLECTASGNSVRFRWYVEALSTGLLTGGRGFHVSGAIVETVLGNDEERPLATIQVPKDENDGGETYKSETVTDVSIPFEAQEMSGTQQKTFRLYAYRATSNPANELDVADGGTPAGNGNWGINALTLHGIVSGPKRDEVTDQDVKAGTWGNQVEVMDGLKTGYDTHRSGLWMKNDGGSYAQKLPEFTVTYPTHSGMDPSLAGEVVWSDTFNVEEHADANIEYTADAKFTDNPTTAWTLTGGATVAAGTTDSGRVLKFPGGDDQTGKAVQTKAVAMTGKVAITAQATARVRSSVAASSTEVTPVNGFTLTVEFLSSGDEVMGTATEPFTATRAWKYFTVGPVTLENNLVSKVRVTIEEAEGGTGLEADSVEAMSSAFASMSSGAPDNEVMSARLKLKAPALNDAVETDLPLSQTTAATWKYGLTAKIYDYDHDRDDDALPTSRPGSFFLYDDDEQAPQWGRQFGGPFGVTMSRTAGQPGTLLGSKNRIANGGGTNIVWSLSDHALAESAGRGAHIGFMVDFYDFSGWRVQELSFQKLDPATGAAQGAAVPVVSGGSEESAGTKSSVTAGGSTYNYTRTTTEEAPEEGKFDYRDYGEANSPGAKVGWTLPAAGFYQQHKSEYENASVVVTNAVNAIVTDLDHDRADDLLATTNALGYFRLLDQDVTAPVFRAATGGTVEPKFRAVLVATNVPSLADLKTQPYTTTENAYALGGYTAHRGATADVASRTLSALYDSELLASITGDNNHFVIAADIVDPTENMTGRSNTGVRRGTTTTTDGIESALEATSFTVNNTYLELESGGTTVNMAAAYNGDDWSDPQSQTKISTATRYSSWVWPIAGSEVALTNQVGQWLPSGVNSKAWTLKFHAYDDDRDRDGDQSYALLTGPTLTVRDDDTAAPGDISGVKMVKDGEEIDVPASVTRDNATWYNADNIDEWKVKFTKAEDGDNTASGDLNVSGVAADGYRMMKRTEAHPSAAGAAWLADGVELTTLAVTTPESDSSKRVATLASASGLTQGLTTQLVFAVDADCDRPGDALASAGVAVPLAYDITPPTAVKFGTSSTGSDAHDKGASTDHVDDPTTQFDLTWYAGDVGPDDPALAVHPDYRKPVEERNKDLLSPWETYKVYYKEYDETAADRHTGYDDRDGYIWGVVLEGGLANLGGAGWKSVTKDTQIVDSSARPDQAYAAQGMGAVSESTTQTLRLFDLDFDRNYVVVIVGVDKAGNEGPYTELSWATNNTIKFALTQGVVRASAQINKALEGANLADIGMQTISLTPAEGYTPPKKGAQLFWMAAGQKDGVGNVTKEYDLIWRDAGSFAEKGTEQWQMASSGDGKNSGTSKTNWNYQVDNGGANSLTNLSRKKLRFYRASYHNRWQDAVTNAGVRKAQLPLASEEVYSMNRVPLVQGTNLVALQGVPWRNTLGAVFGTDTGVLPAGMSIGSSATRVGFFGNQDGFVLESTEEFYFLYDSENSPSGNWRNADNLDVTHRQPGVWANGRREWYTNTVSGTTTNWYKSDGKPVDGTPELDEEFFSRGFLIWLPELEDRMEEVPVKTNEGWSETNPYVWHYGLDWYPILKVPTTNDTKGGFARVAEPSGSPSAKEWYEWKEVGGTFQYARSSATEVEAGKTYYEKTASMPWSFSVRVQGGGVEEAVAAANGHYGAAGRRYTVVSLNMPVAAGPEQMRLRECGFHAGNGHTTGDLIYLYDNETGGVRDSTVVFFDSASQSWKTTGQGGDRDLPARSGYFKPNDVILIVAMGDENGVETDDWMWTYSPSDFYEHMPDRWMGRKRE